jgi:hypothetical protein
MAEPAMPSNDPFTLCSFRSQLPKQEEMSHRNREAPSQQRWPIAVEELAKRNASLWTAFKLKIDLANKQQNAKQNPIFDERVPQEL